jgi:hypothetical protein
MDKNYYSVADADNFVLKDMTFSPQAEGLDPALFDDILKLSHARFGSVQFCNVDAEGKQRENAIDMNRECVSVEVKNCRLVSGQQNAITIKGGCYGILLENIEIVPGSGHCDIELGNWSDQSQNKVTQVVIRNVWRTDNKPVRIAVGHADFPRIEMTHYKYQLFRSAFIKLYCWIKRTF